MCALFLAVCLAISMAGSTWFRIEANKSRFRKPFMCPVSAAINMMREHGASRPVGTSAGAQSYYDVRAHSLMITPAVAERRDIQGVAIAMHEAAHAIQHNRFGSSVFYLAGVVLPLSVVIASFDLFFPIPCALAAIMALVTLRAVIEADAWLLANHVLRRWKLPGVPKRMMIAAVLSYL